MKIFKYFLKIESKEQTRISKPRTLYFDDKTISLTELIFYFYIISNPDLSQWLAPKGNQFICYNKKNNL